MTCTNQTTTTTKKEKQGYNVSEGKAAASDLPSCGQVRPCHACCQSADATLPVKEELRGKMAPWEDAA